MHKIVMWGKNVVCFASRMSLARVKLIRVILRCVLLRSPEHAANGDREQYEVTGRVRGTISVSILGFMSFQLSSSHWLALLSADRKSSDLPDKWYHGDITQALSVYTSRGPHVAPGQPTPRTITVGGVGHDRSYGMYRC